MSNNPADKLKFWRKKFGIKQVDLAKRMAVSPSVLSDYEKGRRPSPGVGFIKKYLKALFSLAGQSNDTNINNMINNNYMTNQIAFINKISNNYNDNDNDNRTSENDGDMKYHEHQKIENPVSSEDCFINAVSALINSAKPSKDGHVENDVRSINLRERQSLSIQNLEKFSNHGSVD